MENFSHWVYEKGEAKMEEISSYNCEGPVIKSSGNENDNNILIEVKEFGHSSWLWVKCAEKLIGRD